MIHALQSRRQPEPEPEPEPEPDRLAHAKIYANELSKSRLREIKLRWTDGKRAQKTALIQHQKPWLHATGPKTAAGKAQSSLNAFKDRACGPVDRAVKHWMREQARFVRRVNRAVDIATLLRERGFSAPSSVIQTLMTNSPETLDDILRRLRGLFTAEKIQTAPLDARLIVQLGTGFSEVDLITKGQSPLSKQHIENIGRFAARRLAGEPVSRLRGEKEFWGLNFKISPDTLDPRPDTETLVESALKRAKTIAQDGDQGLLSMASVQLDEGLRILDLGTGSGCILISLLKELPRATGVGIDLNPGAVAVSRENALRHGVEDRVEFRVGSWFEPLDSGEAFDLIVSNPPYIPESEVESLAKEVRNHDPIQALTAGKGGLEAYKKILMDLKNHLVCGGYALFEIGQGQEAELARLVDDSNMMVCDSYPDLAGVLRVMEITRGEK